jgi:gas vesicle protein GvpL/GvpF
VTAVTAAATAWYVYGIVAADAGDDLTRGVRGVGSDVRIVQHGSLAAIVSEVPLDEFGEDVLPERLNDRAWLESKARAHEDVLQAFAGSTAVVPLRFGAIYRDRADVAALLAERGDAFAGSLERVRGHVELGVKGWADRARLTAGPETGAVATTSGRSYLEQRLQAREAAAHAGAQLSEIVHAAHERLLALAADGVANRPQPRELTGRADEMVLNAAYLVAEGDGSFAREVERLDAEGRALGISFELTGPWPPHNFVDEQVERP